MSFYEYGLGGKLEKIRPFDEPDLKKEITPTSTLERREKVKQIGGIDLPVDLFTVVDINNPLMFPITYFLRDWVDHFHHEQLKVESSLRVGARCPVHIPSLDQINYYLVTDSGEFPSGEESEPVGLAKSSKGGSLWIVGESRLLESSVVRKQNVSPQAGYMINSEGISEGRGWLWEQGFVTLPYVLLSFPKYARNLLVNVPGSLLYVAISDWRQYSTVITEGETIGEEEIDNSGESHGLKYYTLNQHHAPQWVDNPEAPKFWDKFTDKGGSNCL